MQLPIYQVDAFASRPFSGNPAAVCPLDAWLPDQLLQAIAAENNLAETAFFVRSNGTSGSFELRWFTPACEVDLCGHATLASAHVLLHELHENSEVLRFQTKSGELRVKKKGDLLALDFPSRPPQQTAAHPKLLAALGGQPQEVLAARDYLIRFETAAEVAALRPNFADLADMDRFAVIVTAPGPAPGGAGCDFVSRFFAPARGINEDPVTGSAHSTLIPYWAQQLGKTTLHARQISARGGELFCELNGDRVEIAGHSSLFLRGTISLAL
jgi:PhzF family phenazine biosynthesis protein